MNRETMLQKAKSCEVFDLLIIGGGATGLGTAVDAAARGHSVLLVEQADFAQGTSSRSTKLVHGGVRYLKQGNVSLVLEALRERGLLVQNAPHLVHSLPFIIPNYHWWEGPFYGIGMKVYDGLAGSLGLEPSRWLTKEEVLELLPNLEPESLNGGIIYHDGQFDDARLAIALAQTAHEQGAVLLNHTSCIRLIQEGAHLSGAQLRDAETGEEWEVRARCIINATGIFADKVRQLDDADAQPMLSLSQGIHLVLPAEFLQSSSAIMIPKTDDGRVLFAVPWHGKVIVGTTDTAVEHATLEPRALDEEVEFIFTQITRYLSRDPQREDVLSVFAGLRPLIKAGASSTAALSRDHHLSISSSGLITIAGGKWTTYRKMAEDVVDHAEMVGALKRRTCCTHELPIHGHPEGMALPSGRFSIYGKDAVEILNLAQQEPRLAEPIHPKLETLGAEVVWAVRQEMACRVEDVLARRTRALLLDARSSMEAAPKVAALLAKERGHSEAWQQQQVQAYQQLAKGYLLDAP